MTDLYRYTFDEQVPSEEIETALLLAIWGCEALHGEAPTRLDAGHAFDRETRRLVIDAATPVGRDLNRLFLGFLGREVDPDSFQIERLAQRTHSPQESAA